MEKPWWAWAVFYVIIFGLLFFDLGVLHRKTKKIDYKESLLLSGFYIFIAMLFGLFILKFMGFQSMSEYYTGFLIEKSLAIDNIFLILMVFNLMKIDPKYQHRVLFWGIIGVIIMRFIMITAGISLVKQFNWILYVFSAFLIVTGFLMLKKKRENEKSLSKSKIFKILNKIIPHTTDVKNDNFFVQEIDPKTKEKRILATPLFMALIFIEFIDLIFAIDSIPAIMAITLDRYIIYTSNIFAILGLRALYFALAGLYERFKYLKYALGILLIFIGSKIFIAYFMGIEKFPASVSLPITALILASGILFSFYKTKNQKI